MKKSNSRIVVAVLVSGVATVISYLINLLMTPYLTDRLGMEAYGFVSVAKSAVGYAGIITIALTSFVVRFISVSYHEGDADAARKYYASSVAAALILSGSICLVALAVISRLEYVLNISAGLVNSVKLLFAVIFINFVLTTTTTPFSAAFYIRNRLDISGIIKIIAYLCEAGVMVLLFACCEPSIWYVGLGTLFATLVILICSYGMTKRLTPELYFRPAFVSWDKVKRMMRNGIWNSLNSVGNVMNSGLDLLITNLLLSGTAMGQIAVVKTINTMFTTLYQVIYQPFQPQLIKVYAQGDVNRFTKELKKVMYVCGCFASLAFAGFLAVGKVYYTLWLPKEDTLLLYRLTIVTVLLSLTEGIMQPVYYVNTLTLKNKLPCFITIGAGLINIAAMYLLLTNTDLGPFAVVGTTTVIMLCINLFFNPIYSAHCLQIPAMVLYRILFRHFLAAGGTIAALWIMARGMHPRSWMGFFLCVIPLSVVGIAVYVLVTMDREDRASLKAYLKRVCRRPV